MSLSLFIVFTFVVFSYCVCPINGDSRTNYIHSTCSASQKATIYDLTGLHVYTRRSCRFFLLLLSFIVWFLLLFLCFVSHVSGVFWVKLITILSTCSIAQNNNSEVFIHRYRATRESCAFFCPFCISLYWFYYYFFCFVSHVFWGVWVQPTPPAQATIYDLTRESCGFILPLLSFIVLVFITISVVL